MHGFTVISANPLITDNKNDIPPRQKKNPPDHLKTGCVFRSGLKKEISLSSRSRLKNATRLMSGTVLFATFVFVAFLAYAIVTALFQVSASFRL